MNAQKIKSIGLILLVCCIANVVSAQTLEKKIDSLQQLVNKAPTITEKIRLMNKIGQQYLIASSKENIEKALKCFNESELLARKTKCYIGLANTLTNKAFCFRDDPSKQEKLLQQSLKIAVSVKDTFEQAGALSQLGVMKLETNTQLSGQYLQKALKLYKQINHSAGIMSCSNQLAYVFRYKGEYKKAIEYGFIALRVAEKSKNKEGIGVALMGLADNIAITADMELDSISKMAKFDKALAFYTRAKGLFEDIGSEEFLSSSLVNMAQVYQHRNELVKALNLYQGALKNFKKNSHVNGINICLCAIGGLFRAMKEYPKAEQCLKQSLQISHATGNKQFNMTAATELSGLYIDQKKYAQAVNTISEYTKLAKEEDAKDILLTAYGQLADVYSKMNDYKQAYQYQQSYSALKDTLFNTEKSKQIEEMKTKYETEKKAKAIVLLNKDKGLMQAKITKKNWTIISVSIGAVLIIVLLFLLYNRRNLLQKNLHQKELNAQQQHMALTVLKAQEIERQQIARDMHDSVGAYLSSLKLNMESIGPELEKTSMAIYGNMRLALQKVTSEIRALAHNLVSDTLNEYGLSIAIEELAELINRSGKLKVDFTYEGSGVRLLPEVEISIFRIVQELLNNSLKHAGANAIRINIAESQRLVSVLFSDNGRGFDYQGIYGSNDDSGIGLQNIQARASIMKGSFRVDSKPGEGAQFAIEIPKNAA